MDCLFHSDDSVLWCINTFNFWWSPVCFSFWWLWLWCRIQEITAKSNVLKLSLFSSESGSFKSYTWVFDPNELIFIYGVRWVQLCSLARGYPVFSTPFVEKVVHFPLNGLVHFPRVTWHYIWEFLDSLFYSTGLYVCLSVSVLHYFDYCSFSVHFEIRKWDPFKIVLYIWVS